MRFRRVRLTNFKGTEDRSLDLARDGVTLLVGPNEVGKSSVAEAIDLLFDYPDSSSHRDVKAAKPVHRDEGAEVEVEVEAGAYRFTYAKRFHRKRETRLVVHAPEPENLTGREAHDRVERILAESVDLALWRALRIRQGDALALPDLEGRPSLVAALDRAAGGSRSGAAEETLFESVEAEYRRYVQKNGRERKEITDARAAREAAEAEVGEIQDALDRVEDDVARHARLSRELADLAASLPELETRAKEHEESLRAIEELRTTVERLSTERDAAAKRHEEAERRRRERADLVARVETREREHGDGRLEDEKTRPVLEAAEKELAAAEASFGATEQARRESAEALARASRDFEICRARLDLEQLKERHARVEAARKDIRAAEEVRQSVRVDDEKLDAIRAADLEVERARARAEPAGAELELHALRDLSVDGDAVASGEALQRRIEEETHLEIEGVARIEIRPGASAADLVRARREAEGHLAALLADAGVESLEDASVRNEQRRDAERRIEQARKAERESLRDLGPEQLEGKIASLTARLAGSPDEEAPAAGEFDEAQRREREAREVHEAREGDFEKASESRETARRRVEKAREAWRQAESELQVRTGKLKEARSTLEAARAATPDGDLERDVESRARAREEAERAHGDAEKDLAAKSPDAVKQLADNAGKAVEGARRDVRAKEEERNRIHGALASEGAHGHGERKLESEARLHQAERAERSLLRRAAAAARLYETMREKRDAARKRYAGPLADRIESLGRIVFGDSFAVTLDDDLRVTSRTLDGVTVPFEHLSGGAREQIGVITRLAGAMIVAGDGGVPVILDDALGYADPGRQERLAAVLAIAGRECQILVLTCVPERYRHLADARRVELDGA